MFTEYQTFDIAEALYFWLQHNWIGQSDPLYADFCTLTAPGMFSPGAGLKFDNIEDTAEEVYDTLSRDNYKEALNIVLGYKSEDT